MKAWLTNADIPFEKTHDLTVLLDLCSLKNPGLERWRDAVEELAPYAVAFRYPGDMLEPEQEDARNAFALAEGIVADITRSLS